MILWLVICVMTCVSSLSEKELQFLLETVQTRPNLEVNGIQASEFEVTEGRSGLITLRTNMRPGYMEPGKAGYPLQLTKVYNVLKSPIYAQNSTCIPTDEPLGITIYGTLIYSVSLAQPGCPQADEIARAAAAQEAIKNADYSASDTIFDECGGHVPTSDMLYHVYMWSSCFQNITCSQPSGMIGIAFDGFPIYGPIDETGRQLTTVELDECHGKVASDGSYRYHATIDYPYFVSCYKGVLHKDVGINYPVRCTCPHDDTTYIEPKRLPYQNYTIGYEWIPLFTNLSLIPCTLCTEVRKYNEQESWLNYQKFTTKMTVCEAMSEHRFTEVIERRLAPGRLPPGKEYDYYSTLRNKEGDNGENEHPVHSPNRATLCYQKVDIFLNILLLFILIYIRQH